MGLVLSRNPKEASKINFCLIWHRKLMRAGMQSDGSTTCVSCGRCSRVARSAAETGSGRAMTSGTAGRSATESATSGAFLPPHVVTCMLSPKKLRCDIIVQVPYDMHLLLIKKTDRWICVHTVTKSHAGCLTVAA